MKNGTRDPYESTDMTVRMIVPAALSGLAALVYAQSSLQESRFPVEKNWLRTLP